MSRHRIQVLRASLTRDTDPIGKMDCYVKMKFKHQDWKSNVLNNCGKEPRW